MATAHITPLPRTWLSNTLVWVDQWPLKGEWLEQTYFLVKQQLEAGHIEPSNSPWNSPIFVVPKKSGKWRLIHDLRKINEFLQPMGPLQPGVRNPACIPKDSQLLIIDLKIVSLQSLYQKGVGSVLHFPSQPLIILSLYSRFSGKFYLRECLTVQLSARICSYSHSASKKSVP